MTHWARFRHRDGHFGFGTLDGERIVAHDGNMFDQPSPTRLSFSTDSIDLLAPCTPTKIVALWNNFHALATKLDKPEPAHPLFLIKPATSLAGPGQKIDRPASYRGKIAFEGELGIVIGRHCKEVPVEYADDYIFGYTCVNDITAAEVLNADPTFAQWCRAKGYDTFACVGPVIASDFDWTRARVITRLDGIERQNYPLSDMIYSPAEQVSRISHDMTLLPGDVIACGTSLGVGSMKDGSTIEIYVDGIGSLMNTLRP